MSHVRATGPKNCTESDGKSRAPNSSHGVQISSGRQLNNEKQYQEALDVEILVVNSV